MNAIDYLGSYEGNFGFLRSMREKVERGESLSPSMIGAIERCEQAERRPFVVPPTKQLDAADGLDLRVLPPNTSRYAVKNSEGNLTFFRIDQPTKSYSRWIGFIFVKHVSGQSEERIGVQRPGSAYTGKFVGLLGKVLHDPWGAMARYGQEIGECGKCGRRLTDGTSRSIGIGPECRKKGTS